MVSSGSIIPKNTKKGTYPIFHLAMLASISRAGLEMNAPEKNEEVAWKGERKYLNWLQTKKDSEKMRPVKQMTANINQLR
jgi:hypothetical protein